MPLLRPLALAAFIVAMGFDVAADVAPRREPGFCPGPDAALSADVG